MIFLYLFHIFQGYPAANSIFTMLGLPSPLPDQKHHPREPLKGQERSAWSIFLGPSHSCHGRTRNSRNEQPKELQILTVTTVNRKRRCDLDLSTWLAKKAKYAVHMYDFEKQIMTCWTNFLYYSGMLWVVWLFGVPSVWLLFHQAALSTMPFLMLTQETQACQSFSARTLQMPVLSCPLNVLPRSYTCVPNMFALGHKAQPASHGF